MQRCIDSINVTTLPFRCGCSNIFLSDMTIGQSIQILYFLTGYQVAWAFSIHALSVKSDHAIKFGRGGRNRTLVKSFGDSYSTVELRPYISRTVDDLYIIPQLPAFVNPFFQISLIFLQILRMAEKSSPTAREGALHYSASAALIASTLSVFSQTTPMFSLPK